MGDRESGFIDSVIAADLDRGISEHDEFARPRPYPYTPSEVLTLTAGAIDTFPAAYTTLIPQNTFDFGDSPNYIQIKSLWIESMSANDTYIIEFYKYEDTEYVPIGANRLVKSGVFTRSFFSVCPIRPLNNDVSALYGRLKSALGGNTITFSLVVARWLPMSVNIPLSTGVWPTG